MVSGVTVRSLAFESNTLPTLNPILNQRVKTKKQT